MKRAAWLLCLVMTCLSARGLDAEQRITLKSGVKFVGEIKFEGEAIVIEVAGASQRIAIDEIASIEPARYERKDEAKRLLVRGLESRIWDGTPKDAVGLLAEAERLDPDDPQITFWLASNLLDAGFGKIASKKFQDQRAALEAVYPAQLADLEARIQARLEIEKLPRTLVARIDQFNADAARAKAAGNQWGAIVFRVMDQSQAPLDREAFQINDDNAGNVGLETFEDNYFLFITAIQRGGKEAVCHVTPTAYGLKRDRVELRARASQATLNPDLIVHRYGDDEKIPLPFVVVDRDGTPLQGVRIELMEMRYGQRGPSAETDGDGRAAVPVYPGEYAGVAKMEGFNGTTVRIALPDKDAAVEQHVVLYRAASAVVRIVWRTTSVQGGLNANNGETAIQLNPQVAMEGLAPLAINRGDMGSQFRLVQDKEDLALQLLMRFTTNSPTVKRQAMDPSVVGQERRRLASERFDAIDLDKIDQLPEEFQPANLGGGNVQRTPLVSYQAKIGDILVGKVLTRDVRNGQPAEMAFKAVFEPLAEASAP